MADTRVRFDDLADPAVVERWIDEGEGLVDTDTRTEFPDHRIRSAPRYLEFLDLPTSGLARWILNAYVRGTIPMPYRTEGSFWAVSCLPSSGRRSGRRFRLLTCNVFRMETLWLRQGFDEDDGVRLHGHVNVSQSALVESAGDLATLAYDRDLVEITRAGYDSAEGDALRVWFDGLPGLLALEDIPGFDRAARAMVVALMRKGRTNFSGHHCPDLAGWGLREFTDGELAGLLGAGPDGPGSGEETEVEAVAGR